MKSPLDILHLVNNGLDIKKVNVGNMSSKSNTEVIRPSVSVTPEEKEAFAWLKEKKPELELRSTVHAKMRLLHEGHATDKILAIGQKAAWSTGSHYFVNLVQGAGLQGFDGIRRTAELMEEAFLNEKDPKTMIVRKGWGCTSCI